MTVNVPNIPISRQTILLKDPSGKPGTLADGTWYRYWQDTSWALTQVEILASGAQPHDPTLDGLAALDNTLGFVTQIGVDTFTKRTLVAGLGISITEPSGTAANPAILINTSAALTWTSPQTIDISVPGTALQLVLHDPTAASGPNIDLYRDSSSPAANDQLGALVFSGNNSALTRIQYGFILGVITDPTAGSEDHVIYFNTRLGGGNSTRWIMGGALYYGTGIDTGANRVNVVGLDISGTDIFARNNTWTNTNTIQVPNPSGTVFNIIGGTTSTLWTAQNVDPGTLGVQYLSNHLSTSPAANDVLYIHYAQARSSGAIDRLLANQFVSYMDPTNTAEAARWGWSTMQAGALGTRWNMGLGFFYSGGTDTGAGRINVIGLDIAGTNIFARNNTWTADQTIQKTNPILTIDGTGAGFAFLVLQALSGSIRGIQIKTGPGGTERWRIGTNANAESGSNAGADFAISAYDDAGTFLGNPIAIARSTSAITFNSLSNSTDWYYVNTDDAGGGATSVWKKNSASPAAADIVTYQAHQGNSSTGVNRSYAVQYVSLTDPTNGSEDGLFVWQTAIAGTLASRFIMGASFFYAGGSDVGVSNINAVQYWASGVKVVGARLGGWTAATNTKTRTTFDTTTVTLPVLAAHVGALIDDLITHGMIGP